MQRSALDKVISLTGFILAVVLLALAGVLSWGHDFIHDQVSEQLSAQKIEFPAADSEALNALPADDKAAVSTYAGEKVTTGAQAEVFANHYINAHLQNIGGGFTYSELSAQSMANPTDQVLAGKVQTVFRGETLRGLLLNAYAFDTMANVARVAALGSAVAGAVLMVLAGAGFYHAGRASSRRK